MDLVRNIGLYLVRIAMNCMHFHDCHGLNLVRIVSEWSSDTTDSQ
jgi:hypothetical protein